MVVRLRRDRGYPPGGGDDRPLSAQLLGVAVRPRGAPVAGPVATEADRQLLRLEVDGCYDAEDFDMRRSGGGFLGYDEEEKGVIVIEVQSGSKAEKAGIQQGDLIKEINRKPVTGMEDFRKQLNQVKKGDPIMLLLKRGQSGFIVAKMTR